MSEVFLIRLPLLIEYLATSFILKGLLDSSVAGILSMGRKERGQSRAAIYRKVSVP